MPVAARAPHRRSALLLIAAATGGFAWGWWSRAPEAARPPLAATRQAGGPVTPAPGAATELPPLQPWERPLPGGAPVLARFGTRRPSPEVRQLADWALSTGDAGGRALVLVDKRAARVWLLAPDGRLLADAAALLGAAVGDDASPGIGDKPLAAIRPEEKTTPAGRWIAEPGHNAKGEDVVWVSWDLAVSLHRVRPTNPAERRLQRLASPRSDDNRISFGCINLPPAFFERQLQPVVQRHGAVVYVLPETRSLHAQFGVWDVRAAALLAGWQPHAGVTSATPALLHSAVSWPRRGAGRHAP